MQGKNDSTIAYLLLRDGHSVPISGLSPEHLKASKQALIERAGFPLKSQSAYNAIVDCLGFDGDWGTYTNEHWPRVKAFMEEHGLQQYTNLFRSHMMRVFPTMGRRERRSLADRYFFGPAPRPARAFTGVGFDWDSLDQLYGMVGSMGWREGDEDFEPGNLEETKRWLYRNRMQADFLNFIGDQLLEIDKQGSRVVFQDYFVNSVSQERRQREQRRSQKFADVLRWYLTQSDDGWIDFLPLTDNLVFLKSSDGAYDFIWRNLRTNPPPEHTPTRKPPVLEPEDVPRSISKTEDFSAWYYFRPGSWEERERHEAEKHYYAGGGTGAGYPGQDAILRQYLLDVGEFALVENYTDDKTVPFGFKPVEMADGTGLFVSELITIEQMRIMMGQSGYAERRIEGPPDDRERGTRFKNDLWGPANNDDPEHLPTAATWYDAHAYCAWMERKYGYSFRLPSREEYREWFPLPDRPADVLAIFQSTPDGPSFEEWQEQQREKRDKEGPPRVVEKLEEWGGVQGIPERMKFRPNLPWVESPSGLKAIAARDFFEWGQRYVVNPYGLVSCPPHKWGSYKAIKIGFRLVIDPNG